MMQYQWRKIYKKPADNLYIAFSGLSHNKPFSCLATDTITDLGFVESCQCLPLYTYRNDKKIDNITDWAAETFKARYGFPIQKEDIFYYCYAVLHNPSYRKKYAGHLKRMFPRIPLYDDFRKWTDWGKQLVCYHIGFEDAKPFPLNVIETNTLPNPLLSIDEHAGAIILDQNTILTGIPAVVWGYKIGNRSVLESILEGYAEIPLKDPVLKTEFNTYRFADYKMQVIDLIQKVCTVCIETTKIINAMENENN